MENPETSNSTTNGESIRSKVAKLDNRRVVSVGVTPGNKIPDDGLTIKCLSPDQFSRLLASEPVQTVVKNTLDCAYPEIELVVVPMSGEKRRYLAFVPDGTN